MHRIRALALMCLVLSIGPVWATCGGGGGGGRGGAAASYQTNWFKSDWKKVLQRAQLKEERVLLYFQQVDASEHRFFQTKWPNDASKKRLFFKSEGEKDGAKKLRAEFSVPSDKHVVHVCDWWGNSFKSAQRRKKAKYKAGDFKATLSNMKKLAKRLQKKLEVAVTKAEKAEKKGRVAVVVKSIAEARLYKGYDAAERARALWARIVKAGLAEVDAALAVEDNAERRKALTAIKRKYKRTEVAERCAKELDPKRKGRGKDSQSIGTDETMMMRELIGETSAGLTNEERVDEALRIGLEHENAGRYENARESYALAVGLDVNDPIPLVYLGELYRHHLGQWDVARKVFARALELDSDDYASAIALHGIGKMTIWGGDSKKGLKLFAKSIARRPTALCYRNLAVYWNTEGEAGKAFDYATKAYDLDRSDSYNQVFFSVYLHMNGQPERAKALMAKAEFDPSMAYNYACYFAIQGERDLVLKYLKKHFYEYESCDAVRSFEMAEARMDAFFKPWLEDAEFKHITALAGR